jgi:hypothetical protein
VVRKTEDDSRVWSYDPIKNQYVARFNRVDESAIGHYQSVLSSDGKNRAWLLVPAPKEWRGGLIIGSLLLQRVGQDNDIRVPVKMHAAAGSGVPIIPIGTDLKFTPAGDVEFSAATNSTNEWVWTVQIASGKVENSVRRRHFVAAPGFAMLGGTPVPAYLASYSKEFTHFGRGGLAPAFLMHLGILKTAPEYPDCVTGVSRDGRHILYRARRGPLADVFIYGDLETQKTLRWPSPEGIKSTDSMEIVWVETP